MTKGFIYLTVVMDWYSRYVISWSVSISLDADFCVKALNKALTTANKPQIFNTDQGSQYTSNRFTDILLQNDVQISMDGRGRFYDNIFVERLWRSLKYEEVFIKEYSSVTQAVNDIDAYLHFYNQERLHQALDYQTPAQVYFAK